MQHHPIDNMMQTTMEQIRSMVDVNTVIGAPVAAANGATVIPISKVSFGFVAGGGEYMVEDYRSRSVDAGDYPFAGGTGAGVSVQPVGFLVVDEDNVRMLPAQSNNAMERVVELLPQLMEELTHNREKSGKTKGKKVYKTEIETIDYTEPEEQ